MKKILGGILIFISCSPLFAQMIIKYGLKHFILTLIMTCILAGVMILGIKLITDEVK